MTSPTDLVCLLARSSLAIRCVVLERAVSSGKTPRVAICSDELVVKVVDAGDPKRVQLLTGHARGLRAASWNPTQPQLLTCSGDGSVKVWDLSTTEPVCLKTLDSILAISSSQSEQSSEALWHPSGTFFVLPCKTHELVAINAETFQRIGSFVVSEGSHVQVPTGEVTSFAFSSNGRFLASATIDGKVTVWDSMTRTAIRSTVRPSIKTGITWHPSKDALAWTDTMGQLTRWSDVVGPKYPSPCEHVEYLPESQAKQKKQREEIDDLFGGTGLDDDDDDDDVLDVEHQQQQKVIKPSIRRGREMASMSWSSASRSQPVFQPTSTPMRNGRRYLCLNMVGSLMSIDQETHQSISFESHDANARRNWRFVDHFGYTMAAVGATGALLGCPSREGQSGQESDGEDEDIGVEEGRASRKKGHPSSIYFKPFEALGAWSTSGSEWSLNLAKGEDVVAVAMGGRRGKGDSGLDNVTAIVATSTGYLRFFSASGMQRYIWALGSQIISMAAGHRSLLVVHRGNSGAALDQFQNLSYTLIDLSTFAVKQEGTLPLARGATLTWLGFNEMDIPAVYDSRQVLYILDRSLGAIGQARWVPALDTSLTGVGGGSGGEQSHLKFWPVGLETSNLMTVFLKGSSLTYPDPSSSSRPLIQEVKLKMPLLNLDTPMGVLEEQHLRNVQLASLLRSYQAALTDADEEAEEAVLELGTPSSLEHESDKALLQLVQLSCKSDKHQKVLDAAKELHNTRTLDAALQIGAFFHLSSLVDRMGALREWVSTRREREERLVWSGLPIGGSGGLANNNNFDSNSRVLVSQTPSLLDTEDAGAKKTTAAALSSEFIPARARKLYGEGRKSELAKIGHSPSSTWASSAMSVEPSRQSDKENESEEVAYRQKRKAGDSTDDDEGNDNEIDGAEARQKRGEWERPEGMRVCNLCSIRFLHAFKTKQPMPFLQSQARRLRRARTHLLARQV